MQERLDAQREAMRLRRQTWSILRNAQSLDGRDAFLTKRLPRVGTEMSLHVLAYNLKRVMRIGGVVMNQSSHSSEPTLVGITALVTLPDKQIKFRIR